MVNLRNIIGFSLQQTTLNVWNHLIMTKLHKILFKKIQRSCKDDLFINTVGFFKFIILSDE